LVRVQHGEPIKMSSL